jgi:serine/threonine protein phosphatase PrpC
MSDEQILRLLRGEGFANARCQELVEAALEAGGRDNITVLVASFEDFSDRQQNSSVA